MATELIPSWDERWLIAAESTFGTPIAPAGTQAIEVISGDMGAAEVGATRPQKDKTQGRGMTNKFVEGHVAPMPFSLETSVKSRATNVTVPIEAALYKSAGLGETVGGSSVTYAFTSNPVVPGVSLYRTLGTNPTCYEAEQLRGGVIKTLAFSGGDRELTLKASGEGIGKYHLGYIDSVTMLIGDTSLTVSAEEVYRLSPGYYMIESEIILITAVNYATGVCACSRAQLTTSAAAHTTKPMWPHIPTLTLAGSPISEANWSVTVDGVTIKFTSFELTVQSGVSLRPPESGSKYIQGCKYGRYDVKPVLKGLIARDVGVALLGKATQRKACALTIVAGTGAGSIVTFSMPTTEIEPFALPDSGNDAVAVSVGFRVRDDAGNDGVSIVLT